MFAIWLATISSLGHKIIRHAVEMTAESEGVEKQPYLHVQPRKWSRATVHQCLGT